MDVGVVMTQDSIEKRSEPRYRIDRFYSVEFLIEDKGLLYQFRLWNISRKGMCILVREDSPVLERIQAGDIIRMRYYEEGESYPTEYIETQVSHITRDFSGKFQGHLFVGLLLVKGGHTIPAPPQDHHNPP